jgi:hypothetical protein
VSCSRPLRRVIDDRELLVTEATQRFGRAGFETEEQRLVAELKEQGFHLKCIKAGFPAQIQYADLLEAEVDDLAAQVGHLPDEATLRRQRSVDVMCPHASRRSAACKRRSVW